ncbi:MAG: IPT/TIG domain-containing protein, partial [Acidimicrobiales bacterium]
QSGLARGGTSVTISGANYFGSPTVYFGLVASPKVTVVSPTSIVAVSPPESPSNVDVTVATPFGTSPTTKADRYTYLGITVNPSQDPGPARPSGYRLVASDGGVFNFGAASYDGSLGGTHLNAPIVGMAADPATGGYWLVASDGGIFSFNAPFLGSTGAIHLNAPIVGMAADPNGGGYRLVASDGGVFNFGAASYDGSLGGTHLNAPIVGMAADPATGGYWLVASDGGIFSFNAPFLGSTGAIHLNAPIVGMDRN